MLRTLTLKSTMKFGKYPQDTVYSILYVFEKQDYLKWVYYNMSNINFMDDILELIGVAEKIAKPGKNPYMFSPTPKVKKVYERKELTVKEACILKNAKVKRVKQRAKAKLVKEWHSSFVSKEDLMKVNRNHRNLLP